MRGVMFKPNIKQSDSAVVGEAECLNLQWTDDGEIDAELVDLKVVDATVSIRLPCRIQRLTHT